MTRSRRVLFALVGTTVLIAAFASAAPPREVVVHPPPPHPTHHPAPTALPPPTATVHVPGNVAVKIDWLLSIDAIERTQDPPALRTLTIAAPRPVPGALYDGVPAIAKFTFTNYTTHPISGRIVANLGGPILPATFGVTNLAPRASIQGSIDLGKLAIGHKTAFLYYQEQGSPGGAWISKTNTSQDMQVIGSPGLTGVAPYDLVFESFDDNGFPLNPRWGKQAAYESRTGKNDLYTPDARPHILNDCLNYAEMQGGTGNLASLNNGYNPFRNGYCKHSPGATSRLDFYCGGDRYDASPVNGRVTAGTGGIYCSSFAWMDNPWAGKCGIDGDTSDPGGHSAYLQPWHISGHVNFGVVTYDGIARWDNAQAEYNFDSDWCMNLYTHHGAGVTGRAAEKRVHTSAQITDDDEPFVHTEWDPHDVGDQLDQGFWKQFRDYVHDGQQYCGDLQYCSGTTDNQRQTVGTGTPNGKFGAFPGINGRRAIVTGVVGLDVGHNEAGGEIHPVLGVALHTTGRRLPKSDVCVWATGHCDVDQEQLDAYLHPEKTVWFDSPENANDDVWAIWATSFGNEGYCSSRTEHVLDGSGSIIGRPDFSTMVFRIPWAKDGAGNDMLGAEVLASTSFNIQPALAATFDAHVDDRGPRRGIVVTFHFPPSGRRPVWFGELHVKWRTTAGYSAIQYIPPVQTARPGAATAAVDAKEQHPALSKMTDAQRKAFMAEFAKRGRLPPAAVSPSRPGTRGNAAPPAPTPVPPVRITPGTAVAPGAAEETAATHRALCVTHGGRVPKLAESFCQAPPRER